MGIDVYLKWDKMNDEDHKAQLGKGFQTNIGNTGYLREAYHGEPYATQMLVPEAFDEKKLWRRCSNLCKRNGSQIAKGSRKSTRTIYKDI